MAYFNNAFRKTMILTDYVDPVVAPASAASGALTAGDVSIYDARTWAPVALTGVPATQTACQFIIAAGAPYPNDRIGPFHGGYQESIKSKGINPKYVSKVWTTTASVAQPFVLNIGSTVDTVGDADCCPTFLCGEQYHLRVDIKGEAVLRMLNHQGYIEVTADGGCCPDDSVTPVASDPYLIMQQWAEGIWRSAIMTGNGPNFNGATTGNAAERFNPNPFIVPVIQVAVAAPGVIDTLVYPPGTDAAVLAAAALVPGIATVDTWDTFVSAWSAGDDTCAGLMLQTAFLNTEFGDCTFQPSDYYGLEPIRIYASEVDLNGDPCEFTGICIESTCLGRQAQGLGETVVRDFILSESYRQVPFATDLRIREITQGNSMIGTGAGQADRASFYDKLFILHTVPRFNNPSGTFDNDQYLIEIAAVSPLTGTLNAELTDLLDDVTVLLAAANNDDCVEQEAQAPGALCTISVPVTA
tara:strand:+ start:142 stop:1551 length:1410 start_codon:yes stop_codon:yes gene_type:complete